MFKPMLFPNEEIKLEDIKGDYLVSCKLDGIRCIIRDGEMLSRTMKPIRNVKLREKLKPILEYTETHNVVLDGELYGDGMSFQDITSQVMSMDTDVHFNLAFYCFDCLNLDSEPKTANERYYEYMNITKDINLKNNGYFLVPVCQYRLKMPDDIELANKLYLSFLEGGKEGLIFKKSSSLYHDGRPTLKMGVGYKYKPFITWDCKVLGVKQATKVDPSAEKKKDAFGHSKTSRKKDDRIAIERAGALLVDWQGKELLVSLALTNEEKEEIWDNQDKYIGKTIELKGMLVGSKDVPRHPVFIRWREDKD